MADNTDNAGNRPIRSGRGGMIFLTLLILLLIAIGYFVAQSPLGQSLLSDTSGNVPPSPQSTTLRTDPGPMVKLREFLVNIISEDNSNYLKTSMTIELSNTGAQKELETRMPQVRDAILMLISNKTFDELYDLHGKKQLKAEITLTVNSILSSGEVTAVYLTDFIVQ